MDLNYHDIIEKQTENENKHYIPVPGATLVAGRTQELW